MTSDEIIKMARESGAMIYGQGEPVDFMFTPATLQRFVAKVAVAEREACAQVCEQLTVMPGMQAYVSTQCASEIRMRSNAGDKPPQVGLD